MVGDAKCPLGEHSGHEARLDTLEETSKTHNKLLDDGIKKFHKIEKRLLWQTFAFYVLAAATVGSVVVNGNLAKVLMRILLGGGP